MRERELFIDGRWRARARRRAARDPRPRDRRARRLHRARGRRRRRRRGRRPPGAPCPAGPRRIPTRAPASCTAPPTSSRRALAAIADLLTREQGKPVPDCGEGNPLRRRGHPLLRRRGAAHRRLVCARRRARDIRSLVVSSPVGVVGAITPWNYPVDIYAWKVGPALAAGCTLVAKPPHETPLAIGHGRALFRGGGPAAGRAQRCPGNRPRSRRGARRAPGRAR